MRLIKKYIGKENNLNMIYLIKYIRIEYYTSIVPYYIA